MHLDQWKTAGLQLLGHWQRSGISYIPSNSLDSTAQAKDWLELQDATLLTENTPVAAHTPLAAHAPMLAPANAMQDAATLSPAAIPTTDATLTPSLNQAGPVIVSPSATAGNALELPTLGTLGRWGTSLDVAVRTERLVTLNAEVNACRKCEEIVCRRQKTVFGTGPANARIVMFGEEPGAEEDRKGEPFIGAAGELLDKILGASGLKRDEIYILHSMKCRPPNSRPPTEGEIENCRPFLESQLEIIQPNYIVCWGAIAARAVLKSTESVGRLRGRFHAYRGAKVLVTYHPDYLLRNADAKRLTWEDMKMFMRELGIPIAVKNTPKPKS